MKEFTPACFWILDEVDGSKVIAKAKLGFKFCIDGFGDFGTHDTPLGWGVTDIAYGARFCPPAEDPDGARLNAIEATQVRGIDAFELARKRASVFPIPDIDPIKGFIEGMQVEVKR